LGDRARTGCRTGARWGYPVGGGGVDSVTGLLDGMDNMAAGGKIR